MFVESRLFIVVKQILKPGPPLFRLPLIGLPPIGLPPFGLTPFGLRGFGGSPKKRRVIKVISTHHPSSLSIV